MATHPLIVRADQQRKLEEIAAREYRSPEVLLDEAIETLIASRERVPQPDTYLAGEDDAWDAYDGPVLTREQFLAEADASWEDYRRTGLHLTHEEVKQWIEQLKTDPNAQLPECHT